MGEINCLNMPALRYGRVFLTIEHMCFKVIQPPGELEYAETLLDYEEVDTLKLTI